jgi:hypothetical protein
MRSADKRELNILFLSRSMNNITSPNIFRTMPKDANAVIPYPSNANNRLYNVSELAMSNKILESP